MTSFPLSISKNMVLTIEESSTTVTSSKYLLAISYVSLPGDFTEIPSAIVYPDFIFCKEPFSRDCFIAGKALDSTPIIFTLGFFALIAIATPAAKPSTSYWYIDLVKVWQIFQQF